MKVFDKKRYFAIALDPVHIGTGGYRIGRVDNTIVREPATGVPKIPGTTIEGVCRNYAFLRLKENGKNIKLACAKGKTVKKKDGSEEEPCGNCPICITFGYAKKEESLQAMALFSDARILFFPVATMIGPVWITCPMVLKDAGIKEDIKEITLSDDKFIVPQKNNNNNTSSNNNEKTNAIRPPDGKLNFGWLLLEQDNKKVKKAFQWKYEENGNDKDLSKILGDILERVVIVPDDLFATIVNSNLEVRTSVAIDPERGAAEEKALFTYEAIPRATVFWFDVVYQNPENFPVIQNKQDAMVKTIEGVISTVEDGLSLFKYLGVGGMGSRGFGRIKVLNIGGDTNEQSQHGQNRS